MHLRALQTHDTATKLWKICLAKEIFWLLVSFYVFLGWGETRDRGCRRPVLLAMSGYRGGEKKATSGGPIDFRFSLFFFWRGGGMALFTMYNSAISATSHFPGGARRPLSCAFSFPSVPYSADFVVQYFSWYHLNELFSWFALFACQVLKVEIYGGSPFSYFNSSWSPDFKPIMHLCLKEELCERVCFPVVAFLIFYLMRIEWFLSWWVNVMKR